MSCQLVDKWYNVTQYYDNSRLYEKYEESIYKTFDFKQKWLSNGYFRINILPKINNRLIPVDVINLCHQFFVINIKECSINDTQDIIGCDNPWMRLYHFAKNCASMERNEYWIACQILKQLCSIFPSTAAYYNMLGLSFGHWREYKSAEQALETAVQLKPASHIYRWNYALLLDRQYKYHLSLKLYLEAIELDPKEPEYYRKVADSYFELKNYDNAETYYLDAITADPNNAKYYIEIARFFMQRNLSQNAHKYFEKAEKLHITSWNQYYEMAKYYRDYQVFCLCGNLLYRYIVCYVYKSERL